MTFDMAGTFGDDYLYFYEDSIDDVHSDADTAEILGLLDLPAGARILEPSMGVGHFFGLMPQSMQGSQRTGVELDSITARFAMKLYPDSTIFAKGFEETPLPDNYFDAIVGNVPFGDYGVHDPSMKHHLIGRLHFS